MHQHAHDHHTGHRHGAHSRGHGGRHERHAHGHHGYAHHGHEHPGHEVDQHDLGGRWAMAERGLAESPVLAVEAPPATAAGCPRLGGTADCGDDCRTCHHRGVRPA